MAQTSHIRRGVITTALLVAATLAAHPAAAQHRARLSADLADAIKTGSPAIDVIVHGTRDSIDATAARHALKVKRYLKSGAVFQLTAGQLSELQQDDNYDHLSSDIHIKSLDVTTDTIEADQVWAGAGPIAKAIGSGVGVAVIDSGVDFNHQALQGRVAVSVDFTGGDGSDAFGHGTHVAATIAGAQGTTSTTNMYRGVASGAQIINLRVLGADGEGTASSVIEAIDWAIDNKARYNIRVINLSIGATVVQPYRDDPLCEAAERAVSAGIVVVAAAGNFGVNADGQTVVGEITSPGNDPNVLTVGALDDHQTSDRTDDTVAPFSSRGPTMYDMVMKPDLVAPGTHVVSAEAAGSYFATAHADHTVAGFGEDAYMQLSGTSMAAAVASGAVALLIDEQQRLTPNDVKVTLQMTSTLMPSAGLLASGAGSMDIYAAAEFARGFVSAAIEDSLGTSTPSTSFGGSSSTVRAQTVSNSVRTHTNGSPAIITFGTTTVRGEAVLWGKRVANGETYVWAQQRQRHHSALHRVTLRQRAVRSFDDIDTIVWGTDDADTIVWGTDDADTIVWGTDDADTIVWGTDDADTIVWGTDDADTIVWGTDDADTIVWGTDDADTIVWGTDDADTIVWGT